MCVRVFACVCVHVPFVCAAVVVAAVVASSIDVAVLCVMSSGASTIASVFRSHLDVLHFRKLESTRLTGEESATHDEELKQGYVDGDATEAVLAARCGVEVAPTVSRLRVCRAVPHR